MEQEVEQLRTLVEDLFAKVESLEERIGILEDEKAAKPVGPEPILTCVQCLAEYKESENGEGYCKYHNGTINYYKNNLSCCNKRANNGDLQSVPGCTKGKHHSKHHIKYFYTMYSVYMKELSSEAKELWLEMDIYDYITESCEWAEVAISKEGNLFVIAGPVRNRPDVCTEFTIKELKKCKKPSSVVFEKSDDIGWSLKAELLASGTTATAIIMTIKTAWSNTLYAKKVNFTLDGEKVKLGEIKCLSDPRPKIPEVAYSIPEGNKSGPELEIGEDFSKGRKTDYPTKTNDDMFMIELKQLGDTEVGSDMWDRDGKWKNYFTTTIKATNGSMDIISMVDVQGDYKNKNGDWVKCDQVLVRQKGSNKDFETLDFLLDAAAPMTLSVTLGIEIQDRSPEDNQERQRAHHSLPQPLLLRVTFIDKDKRTASLIFEQGNRPLPLATLEKRQASWAKKKQILFYLFADDVDLRHRSDVALYYNDEGVLCYRPAPNDNGSSIFYLRESEFETAAYKAKKSGVKEQELTSFRKESKGSKIELFAIVDLDNQHTFALKVAITTPTSSAVGYYLLPRDDFSQATLTVEQEEVEVNSNLTVKWSGLPRVSKQDMIAIITPLGSKQISSAYNRAEKMEGSISMKVPRNPGEYELHYYPKQLMGTYTSLRHNISVASATFTVIRA